MPNPKPNLNPNTNPNYWEFQLTYVDFDLLASSTFFPSICRDISPAGSFDLLHIGLPVSNIWHLTFRSPMK